ncbi:MAG: hypothetical protein O7D32_08875 [bacterium]|nr:hypothetical protein [bacterium]
MVRKITFTAILATLTLIGCSLVDSPSLDQNEGTVSLVLSRSNPQTSAAFEGAALQAFAAALPVVDSLCILVFPPGNGGAPEAIRCVTVNALDDSVEVNLTVVAENNKRVSVELFAAGGLLFFGVDEDVDVAVNKTTDVVLTAAPFEITTFTRDTPIVMATVSFQMEWNSVVDATSYRLQLSSTPDFAVIDWETSMPDTSFNGSLPEGSHYFRVMAENTYTASNPATQFVYAYDTPTITSVVDDDADGQALRLEAITVYGTSLDYPGTEFYLGSYLCTVLDWGGDQVTLQVPVNSLSGNITVQNALGIDTSSDYMGVYTILYVGEDPDSSSSDLDAALAYMAKIEGYPGLDDGRVSFLPYQWLGIFPVSIFDVIVIGYDTYSGGKWAGGDAARAVAIAFSGANVLAIGAGNGYFDVLSLGIGFSNSDVRTGVDILCWAPASEVFTNPNDFSAGFDETFNLYGTSNVVVSADLPGPVAAGQTLYGRIGGSRFPLVEEISSPLGGKIINILWGYQAPPWDMTGDGDKLFENAVTYLYSDTRSKLP